jgi:uncharacterized membrane protein HdeD (DUF308 family)
MKNVIEKAAIVFGLLTALLFGVSAGVVIMNQPSTSLFLLGLCIILFSLLAGAAALMILFTKEGSDK